MPEGMKGKQGGVQAHVRDPGLEPEVVLRPGEGNKLPSPVGHLEDGVTSVALVLAVHVDETKYGLDGTQQGILRGGERNEVLPGTELVVLGLLYGNYDSITYVVS